jgi:hypothetical protein
MHRSAAIFLIVLLGLNTFGFYFAFLVRQDNARHDMAEALTKKDSDNQQVITLTNAEFENITWINDNKELRYNGNLYDVVQINHSSGKVQLVVESDVQETKLVDGFVSLVRDQSDKQTTNSPVKSLLSQFLKEFVSHNPIALFAITNNGQSVRINATSAFSIVTIERLSPPPQLV